MNYRQLFINNVNTALAMDSGSLEPSSTTIKVVNTPELNNAAFIDDYDHALLTVRKLSTGETEVIKVRSPNNGASNWDGIGTMPFPAYVTFQIEQRDYEYMIDGRTGGITSIDNADSQVYFGITAGMLERSVRYGYGGTVSLSPYEFGRNGQRDIPNSVSAYGLLPQLMPYPQEGNNFKVGAGLVGIAMSNPIDLAFPTVNWQANHGYAHGSIIAPASMSGRQYMRLDDAYPYDDTYIVSHGYTPSSSGSTEPVWASGSLVDDGGGRWQAMINGVDPFNPPMFEVGFPGRFMVTSLFVYAESVTGLTGAAPVITVQDGSNDGQMLLTSQALNGGKTDRWWKFEMPDGTLTERLRFFINSAAGATSFRARFGVTGVLMKKAV